LVANVEVGEELVTPYTGTKGKGTKTKPPLMIIFESNITTNGKQEEPKLLSSSEIMATSWDVALADGETPESTARDIYNSLQARPGNEYLYFVIMYANFLISRSLQIDGGTNILLCIAWCTDKQR
jgi:hypothetical protein